MLVVEACIATCKTLNQYGFFYSIHLSTSDLKLNLNVNLL